MVRNVENSTFYTFDGFCLDAAKRLLYGPDGNPIPLKSKAFDTLLFLVENPGRIVERDELLTAVWPDTVVEENNLTQHISSLRRVFGEKPDDHRFIATVPGRGYMFVAKVDRVVASTSEHPESQPSTRRPPRKLLIIAATIVVVVLLLVGVVYKYQEAGASDARIRSLAVLPFKSEQQDNSWAEWMTVDLINKLALADGLDIRPFAAVAKYRSFDYDAIEVGHVLRVDAVLETTLQRFDEKVQISVRLTKIVDGKVILNEKFNDALTDDFFDVQDQLTARVSNKLTVALSPKAQKRMTENLEAYMHYKRGLSYQQRLGPAQVTSAIDEYQKAIALDDKYALAYAGLADCYRGFILSGENRPMANIKLAVDAAEAAVALNPDLAEAQTAFGSVTFWFKHDWLGAEARLKRALELDDESAIAHHHYSHLLSLVGRHSEAIAEAQKVRNLDASNPMYATIQGLVYQQAGQPEIALERFKEAGQLDERIWLAKMFTAIVYLDTGQYQEALELTRKISELNKSQSMSLAYESVLLAKLGRNDEAQKALNSLLERAKFLYVPPYHIAIAYAGLGNTQKALQWLEKGFTGQDPKLVFLKADHIWDPLRSHPRFIALMEKMNFPEQR